MTEKSAGKQAENILQIGEIHAPQKIHAKQIVRNYMLITQKLHFTLVSYKKM